ncbi:hypothetical protein KKD70_02815 [Patescibacteria group bacterium]|nr:hypothetical protein [Patescibacteria group bacterium]
MGLILILFTQKRKRDLGELNMKNGMILAALSFVILPLIGAIPFLSSFGFNFVDAYFESISGFTTTGLTLFESVSHLPKSLLMWRSEIQWMGGIGIVLFLLFLMTRINLNKEDSYSNIAKKTRSSMALYHSQGFSEKLESSLKHTLKNVMLIYISFTLLGIVMLWLVGLSLFDAVAMAFTSISTGGFSVIDTFYTDNLQLFVLSILMLIGAISFVTHNRLMQRKFKQYLLDYEKNILLIFIGSAVVLSLIVFPDIQIVLFQMISAFTTTGYSITNVALLPQLVILLIMTGMIIGGCTASTAGGIKVSRIYYLLRVIPWYVKKRSLPEHAVFSFKIHDENVDTWKLIGIGIYMITYLFILFLGTVIFMVFGFSFLDSSFQIISALGTVGLQTMDLTLINPFLKFTLILAMILGRLEIFPLLIAFRSILKKN